jgi:hypothetical protein
MSKQVYVLGAYSCFYLLVIIGGGTLGFFFSQKKPFECSFLEHAATYMPKYASFPKIEA